MTINEKIQKIKVLLGLETPAPAPVQPAALNMYKLTDGTEVGISALEVGGIVTVGDQPAPAGEHTLEDGTAIVVDAAGVITEIVAATPAAPAEPVEDDMAAKFSAIESTVIWVIINAMPFGLFTGIHCMVVVMSMIEMV